ncbi:MAG: Fe-S cluster assembly protein SufE [Verrucomicrobiales bacterium]|nr:MAG: Fe-S cluster assembly protein SufE [Verrucomicrobiales bacterium]
MANFLDTTVDDLIGNFEFLGDWEERFAYLIELGKKLPPLDESEMVEDNRVHGCQAAVWLKMLPASDSTFDIHADSDAFIVKGLLAVVLAAYNAKTPQEVSDFDVEAYFAELNLLKHLSVTRGNGLRAMVTRIQGTAAAS